MGFKDLSDIERTEFVLKNLREDEKFNGLPRVNGLRRIVIEQIGPIIDEDLSGSDNGNSNDLVAMAIYKMVVKFGDNDNRRFCAVGSGNKFNIPTKDYQRYAPEMSETRARARAYKQCLMINVMAADEGATDPFFMEKISPTQSVCIDSLCKKMDVNPLKVVKGYANVIGYNKNNWKEMTKNDAIRLITTLNEYHQNNRVIEEEIKGYKNNLSIDE